MHFLVDEGISPLVCDVLRRYGCEGTHVRAAGMQGRDDDTIAGYALDHGMAIMTLDFGFADIRRHPPERYRGIVVLEPPSETNRAMILRLVATLLANATVTSQLPGRLAIVQFGRVRLRPAPEDNPRR
jgi:hypothetical protein